MEIWKRNLLVCWFGTFATALGMSQIAPVLPLYVEHLGIVNISGIEQWSGLAFGITYISTAIFSPVWGQAADKYGRKAMLLRASMGMAIALTCISFVQNVYQLVFLRLLEGIVSGYTTASITLVATQTPKERTGWALGTLATGSIGGTLLGPLFGGYLVEASGLRRVFQITGILLLLAFLASLLFVREDFSPSSKKSMRLREVWGLIPDHRLTITLFVTTFILQIALMSIEPIITVFVSQLTLDKTHIALISGLVFAATGLANMLAAPRLGKLSDKIGPEKVMLVALIAAGVLFIPQSFVKTPWQLLGLRFLLGICTAGLMPSINTLVRKSTPSSIAGRAYGYNNSAMYLGVFSGSLLGGKVASFFGISYVFFLTSFLLLLNSLWVYKTVLRLHHLNNESIH